MARKTVLTAFVSIAMLLTLTLANWSAICAAGLNLHEPDMESSTEEQPKKQGNRLGQVLGAPFGAIGRLFGGGKKRNQHPSRITEKDIAKFEGAQVTRVKDARTSTVPAAPSNESTAKDHLQRGRAFLNAGELNEAILELSAAASLDPRSGEAHTLLGVAYDRKGLRDRAQQSFETAVHAPDDIAIHLNNLGYLLYRHGDYEGAIKYLKHAAKLSPDDQRIWNNLALAQCERGKFDDAFKSFAHTLGEVQGRLKIAAFLERQGLTREAIKQLERARKLRPASTEVLARLVVLYDNAGQIAEANQARASLSMLQTMAVVPTQPDK